MINLSVVDRNSTAVLKLIIAFYYQVKPLFQSSQKPVRTSFCDDWKRGFKPYVACSNVG